MPASIDRLGLQKIAEVIATRRSVRHYVQEPIARELVDELLRCAVHAPSAHNRQPWRFVVIRELETQASLAEAMGSRLRARRL